MSVKNIIFHTCTNIPFDSEFAIRPATCRCKSSITAKDADERIKGIIRNGQMMRHISNSSAGQTEMVDVKNLTEGMYIVRVSNGAQTATQKIFKAK